MNNNYHNDFIELFVNNITSLESYEDYIFFQNLAIGQYKSKVLNINHLIIILYCLPNYYYILYQFIYVNNEKLSDNSFKVSGICQHYNLYILVPQNKYTLNLDPQNIINCYNELNKITKVI